MSVRTRTNRRRGHKNYAREGRRGLLIAVLALAQLSVWAFPWAGPNDIVREISLANAGRWLSASVIALLGFSALWAPGALLLSLARPRRDWSARVVLVLIALAPVLTSAEGVGIRSGGLLGESLNAVWASIAGRSAVSHTMLVLIGIGTLLWATRLSEHVAHAGEILGELVARAVDNTGRRLWETVDSHLEHTRDLPRLLAESEARATRRSAEIAPLVHRTQDSGDQGGPSPLSGQPSPQSRHGVPVDPSAREGTPPTRIVHVIEDDPPRWLPAAPGSAPGLLQQASVASGAVPSTQLPAEDGLDPHPAATLIGGAMPGVAHDCAPREPITPSNTCPHQAVEVVEPDPPIAWDAAVQLIEDVVGRSDVASSRRGECRRKALRLLKASGPELTASKASAAARTATSRVLHMIASREEDKKRIRTGDVEGLLFQPGIDLDSVAGFEDLKANVRHRLHTAFDPDHRRMVEYVSGRQPASPLIMLVGHPGGGKTHFAKAVAGEMTYTHGVKSLYVVGSDIKGLHWSKHLGRVREIFDYIHHTAPCAAIWDELDALVSDPKTTGRKYDAEKSAEFKQHLQGAGSGDSWEVHIATTNYPEQLEIALLRFGRFVPIHVTPPGPEARREIITLTIEGRGTIEPDVDVEKLVSWTRGNSVSEILEFIEASDVRAQARNYDPKTKRLLPDSEWLGCAMSDFAASRHVLKRKTFLAWLRGRQQILSKPDYAEKREFLRDLLEFNPHQIQ